MTTRALSLLACTLAASMLLADGIANKAVTVAPIGVKGACTGFTVADREGVVATVLLGSNDAIKATTVQQTASSLRFTGLSCTPTPTLGPGSFVEVRLVGPDDPYPKVSFRLELQRFDAPAWEAKWGKVPFHFLASLLDGAEVFHQRGWIIGTPAVDDYIQMKCEGPGKAVVSDWSRNWTYAPPVGAYPTAVAGLWHPSARRYVGYEFHGPRLTDHSEKDFGTTYCWDNGQTKQFFCLTWPYGEKYDKLRYPTTPVTCGTSFRLLWSRALGTDDDPNRLVQEFIWKTYADLLP
ncbi:MAG: hypothetical protein KKI08_00075, partial [Armatimonadetes bacterium]|nr:hypothetical protein [Armatimonadota bacterium]